MGQQFDMVPSTTLSLEIPNLHLVSPDRG
jgi:hypothetical protein